MKSSVSSVWSFFAVVCLSFGGTSFLNCMLALVRIICAGFAGIEFIFLTVASMRLCFGFFNGRSMDNSGIFLFLLRSTYTKPSPFLPLTPASGLRGQVTPN